MSACQHEHYIGGRDRPYMGSVAVHPYTDENRAAHGNITCTETCSACGAQRAANRNECHAEYSPWGPSRREQEAREKTARQREQHAQYAEEEALYARRRTKILQRTEDRALLTMDGGQCRWILLRDIRAAANQPDNGDGLAPYYRALARHVGIWVQRFYEAGPRSRGE